MDVIPLGGRGKLVGIELRNAITLAAIDETDRTELRGLTITLLRAEVPQMEAQFFLWSRVHDYDKLRSEWLKASLNTSDEEFDSELTKLAERAEKQPLGDVHGAAVSLAIAIKLREEQEAACKDGQTVLTLEKDTDLHLFFSVAGPQPTGTSFAEIALIDPEAALFALHPGSAIARVLLGGAFTCAKYAVGLVATFRSPDAAARHIKEEMRAIRAKTAAHPLIRLDDPDAGKALKGAKGVLIFLHGLMSTDLGTFDGFIGRWLDPAPSSLPAMSAAQLFKDELPSRARQAIKDSIALVGWPHDTLTGIDVNAQDLVDLIDRHLGQSDCPIAFVCHSRGGLLARTTAQALFDKNNLWRERICGAITFGTPHATEGADFAEHPAAGIGAYLLAAHGSGLVSGLMDALAYIKQRGTVDGIRDLRPRSAPRPNFLYDLREREQKAPHGQRLLRVMTVAGNYQPDPAQRNVLRSIARKHINAYTGQMANDLVVTATSAAAAHTSDAPAGQTNCDHFTYFTEMQTRMAHVDGAIGQLWSCFKLASIVGPILNEPELVGRIDESEKTVTIGPETLKKRD